MHPYLDIMSIRLIAFGWSEWVRICENIGRNRTTIIPPKDTNHIVLILTYRMYQNEHGCKKE
jgi:hypothetical protein